MILQINKNDSLKTFQKQFNEYYPFLKIEFFKRITADEALIKPCVFFEQRFEKKLNGSDKQSVSIDINRKKKIAELEKDFDMLLGLSARVFRRSGNVWVETTLTNDWSLEDQNEEGKQISSHFTNSDSRLKI
jgi:glycerol-3-phosphate O-acyltransferase